MISLPVSPHRPATTCTAASHVVDSSGYAHVSVTTGQATDREIRTRCTDAVAADELRPAPAQVPQLRPRLIQLLRDINSATRSPAGRSSRSQNRDFSPTTEKNIVASRHRV